MSDVIQTINRTVEVSKWCQRFCANSTSSPTDKRRFKTLNFQWLQFFSAIQDRKSNLQ